MSKFMRSMLSMFLAVFMVASLAAIPSSAATPKLSKTSVTITKGYYTTLSVSGNSGSVKWSTGDKSVATVSSKGKVSGKGPGTTYVYAKVDNKTLKCKVTVVASKITASASSIVLDKKGDTAYVTMTVKGSHSLSKGSTNSAVATAQWSPARFDGNNITIKITAKGAGTAKIKVYNTNYTSCYKYINVTVKNSEPEVVKTDNVIMAYTKDVKVNMGETYDLQIYSTNMNNVTYSASNSNVASVSAGTTSGNYKRYAIKGLAAGTTTIRFYDRSNSSIYVDVTVTVASNVKYYEFYTVSPANSKLLYTDQVIERTDPSTNVKYYMLVPADYDVAKVNSLAAQKFNRYEYYTVYDSVPSRRASGDTYKSFTHENSKYNWGTRYILLPSASDDVQYNTAVAKYNGKYDYYTIYNENPTKKDSWDSVEAWNIIDKSTGKTVTRYMLVPYGADRDKVNEIINKDQNANPVYKYYTPYSTYPSSINSSTDTVIIYTKGTSLMYMIVPRNNDQSSITKANDAIYKDTGVYEYNVMYSTKPASYDAETEYYVALPYGNTTYYILYKLKTTDSSGNEIETNINNVISSAQNNRADGNK